MTDARRGKRELSPQDVEFASSSPPIWPVDKKMFFSKDYSSDHEVEEAVKRHQTWYFENDVNRRVRRRINTASAGDGIYRGGQEIAHERIDDAVLGGASKLDLCSLGLEKVPEEIGDMRYMTAPLSKKDALQSLVPPKMEIYLARNRLRVLNPVLFSISNLTVLSLRGNKLTHLPDGIGSLVSLQELNVAGNNLKWLPATVIGIPSLRILVTHPNPFIPLESQTPPSSEPEHRSMIQSRTVQIVKSTSSSHAPRLSELALSIVIASGIQHYTVPIYLQQRIEDAAQAFKEGTMCGVCGVRICEPMGYHLEHWVGVGKCVATPFRRNCCSTACLMDR